MGKKVYKKFFSSQQTNALCKHFKIRLNLNKQRMLLQYLLMLISTFTNIFKILNCIIS